MTDPDSQGEVSSAGVVAAGDLPVVPNSADWVSRTADQVIGEAERRSIPIVVASGISPSGPVHLGNMREVMTPHLVADELRRRGVPVEHIISWDDFDRFRKVPQVPGVDASWEEYIGKPLTRVPAPHGSPAANWAEHFRSQFEESLQALGVVYRGISQSEQYTAGAYVQQVLAAMEMRQQLDEILGRYRTKPGADSAAGRPGSKGKGANRQGSLGQGAGGGEMSDSEQAAAVLAAAGSGAATEDDGSASGEYYPYKPYCDRCGRDSARIIAYDDDSKMADYACDCGYGARIDLRTHTNGKLVWKIDWPMRWAFEGVVFEPSGVDHQSPGSSFVVGRDVAPLFGWKRPIGPMYAFVGIQGMAKMSSSAGGVPIPADALAVMEPALLRWMYARRRPNQSFTIALDAELGRLYDEWDALCARVDSGKANAAQQAAYVRAATTAEGWLPATERPESYRTLGSIVDVTAGDPAQIARIVGQLGGGEVADISTLRPRLDLATAWRERYVPDSERTLVRVEADQEFLAGLTLQQRQAIDILLDGHDDPVLPPLAQVWSLPGLTSQVYAVPKVQRGMDAQAIVRGDKALSSAQRAFFTMLYEALVADVTGPRLPTLLLAIGLERVQELLRPEGG